MKITYFGATIPSLCGGKSTKTSVEQKAGHYEIVLTMQIYNKWLRGRVLNELCKRISDTKHLDCAYLRYTRLRGCVFSVFCKRISDTKHLDCAYLRYTRLRGCVFSVFCKRISDTKHLDCAYPRYTRLRGCVFSVLCKRI